MNRIGIIIQARMGSSRLPGKVLKPVADRVLLSHVLGRLEGLKHAVSVIVATSTESQDDVIEEYCNECGFTVFRGSEHDVLARYFESAKKYGFDQIVRLTADNPFSDIDELDRLIEFHLNENNDYSHSFGDLPLGVGAEIFTFNALNRSYNEGYAPNHREHVNEYIQENPEKFKIGQLKVPATKTCPDLRLTVDTEQDYQRACRIASHMPGSWITTEQAIELCLHSV